MKKILAALFASFIPLLACVVAPSALAQGAPPNCTDTGGQHLNYTAATHSWSCGTSVGTASIIINTTAVTGGTATRVLFEGAGPVVTDSANFVFDDTNKRLTIGTGSGTSTGLIMGYRGSSGSSAIWPTSVSPATDNFTLYASAGVTYLGSGGTSLNDVVHIAPGFGGVGDSKYRFYATAGKGMEILSGTATTDVAALSVTRTNNNAAVATGVKFTFTDTTSAAGFLPFQILCGSAGTANCLSVDKAGLLSTIGDNINFDSASSATANLTKLQHRGTTYASFNASGFGFGTNLLVGTSGGKAVISTTAPTIASGGCTSPTVTNSNGTARFQIDVGTSCSGSQPVVFTLPAATNGWECHARNITNGATSAPAQTGAVSTTSVTITNFARTTGLAAAWTDGDDVAVTCMGG